MTLFVVISLLPLPGMSSTDPAQSTSAIHFSWDGTKGSLSVQDAPLPQVLGEISKTTGIPVKVIRSDARTVTLQAMDATLEEIVQGLVGDRYAIMTEPDHNGQGQRISKVLILAGQASSQSSRDTAKEARTIVEQHRPRGRHESPPIEPFAGAGIFITRYARQIWMQPMAEDAPAAQAGIVTGDRLLAVDDVPVQEIRSSKEIADLIRGPVGSTVILTVKHLDDSEENVVVVRGWIGNEAIEQSSFRPRELEGQLLSVGSTNATVAE